MSVSPLNDDGQDLPAPQNHTIGFANTYAECNAIARALNVAGFPDAKITILNGEDGVHLLKRLLGGSLWGETAEDVMKQGVIELNNGHFALVIETEDRDEAMIVSSVATSYGGHNFNHFGVLEDERLTK